MAARGVERLVPSAFYRPCPVPGCPTLVLRGCCEAHGGVRKAWVKTAPGPPRLRGRANQQRRHRVFTRNPLCVPCAAQGRVRVATIADHVVPLAQGGADDESNLQGICKACHRVKTQGEAARGRW